MKEIREVAYDGCNDLFNVLCVDNDDTEWILRLSIDDSVNINSIKDYCETSLGLLRKILQKMESYSISFPSIIFKISKDVVLCNATVKLNEKQKYDYVQISSVDDDSKIDNILNNSYNNLMQKDYKEKRKELLLRIKNIIGG